MTGADMLKLADEYEAGLRKMEVAGYEEFAEVIPKHKLVIAALRASAERQSGEVVALGRCQRLGHCGFGDLGCLCTVDPSSPGLRAKVASIIRGIYGVGVGAYAGGHQDKSISSAVDAITAIYAAPSETGNVTKTGEGK